MNFMAVQQLPESIAAAIEKLLEESEIAYDQGNVGRSFDRLVDAFSLIPDPKYDYGESFNHCSYLLDFILDEPYHLDQTTIWVERLHEIADHHGTWKGQIDFYEGKASFRLGRFAEAKAAFDRCVDFGKGMRYFYDEPPEYANFYRNPEWYGAENQ